jgi:hypothetical protein
MIMKYKTFVPDRKEKGQALVEFSLIFPVFLGIIVGIMAFAMLFYSYVTMQLAVREGARALVGDPKTQTVQTITDLVKLKSFSLNPSALTVVVQPPKCGGAYGTPCSSCPANSSCDWFRDLTVSVSATYYVPLPSVTIPVPGGSDIRFGPIPITAISNMTIE